MNRVTVSFWLILAIASAASSLCTGNVFGFQQDVDAIIRPTSANSSFKYYRAVDDAESKENSIQDGSENSGVDEAADGSSGTQDIAKELWSRKSILATRIDIRESHTAAPKDRSSELNYGSGDWTQFSAIPKVFAWAAPDIRYRPLYFEDVALERYGQTGSINVQPIRSAAHMFKSVVLLPHHVLHDHPDSCDYPLGFCRPGSDVPCTQQVHYFGRPNR